MSEDRLEELEEDFRRFREVCIKRFRAKEDEIEELNEKLAEKDDYIYELEQEIDHLSGQVEILRDRTQLFEGVRRNAASTPEERAVVCIKQLYNEAWRRQQKGNDPSASLTAREGMKTLGGSVARESMYPTFERAESMIDSSAVYYRTEDRSSKKKSRLILDLTVEDVPQTVSGYAIHLPDGTPVDADAMENVGDSL